METGEISSAFIDTKGRRWPLCVDYRALRSLKASLGLNLMGDDKGISTTLGQLAADPVLLIDTIYVICEPLCREREITDEEFGAAFNGETLVAAQDALVRAIADFSPPLLRKTLNVALRKAAAIQGIQDEISEEQIEEAMGSSPSNLQSSPQPALSA